MTKLEISEQILAGKTCLITGGGGGLGKAIATKFLEAGANVVICDINEERLQETSAELSSKGPLKAIKADITKLNEVEALFAELIAAFGKIDVLVNNAAIMDTFNPVGDLEIGQWDRVMALNLTAPFVLSKLAVRNMLEQSTPDGRIINITSVAGRAGWAAGMCRIFCFFFCLLCLTNPQVLRIQPANTVLSDLRKTPLPFMGTKVSSAMRLCWAAWRQILPMYSRMG